MKILESFESNVKRNGLNLSQKIDSLEEVLNSLCHVVLRECTDENDVQLLKSQERCSAIKKREKELQKLENLLERKREILSDFDRLLAEQTEVQNIEKFVLEKRSIRSVTETNPMARTKPKTKLFEQKSAKACAKIHPYANECCIEKHERTELLLPVEKICITEAVQSGHPEKGCLTSPPKIVCAERFGEPNSEANPALAEVLKLMQQQMQQQNEFIQQQSEQLKVQSDLTQNGMKEQRTMNEILIKIVQNQTAALEKQNELVERQLNQSDTIEPGVRLKLLKKLPNFDGRSGPSIVKFFKDFEKCAELEGWSDETTLKWIKLKLTGLPKDELENAGQIRTLAEAKKILFERYLSRQYRDRVVSKINHLKQTHDQTVLEFFEEHLELNEVAHIDVPRKERDRALRIDFLTGLYSQEAAHHVERQSPSTAAEALTLAQREEMIESARAQRYPREDNESMMIDNSRTHHGNRIGKCYCCGERGHLA